MSDEQSIWKKEISFRKKAKPDAAEKPAAAESGDEPTSIWKKEISFGRKKKDEPVAEEPVFEEPVVEEPVAEAQPVVEAEGATWTRAVSFGRRTEAEEPVAQEPVVDEPVAEEPVAEEPVEEPVVELVAEAEPVPEDVVAEDEPAAEEAVWTRAVSFSPRAEAEEPEPVAEEPTETWSAQPTLPPEPEPEPAAAPEPVAAQVVHPPVPSAELPPLPGEQKKVPFWKKEISLGGKKAERAPKQPRQAKKPKEPKQPKQRAPKAPKVKVDRGSRGSKKLVGLKIGASQLAAARVANNGSAELLQVAREPLTAGVVVGGELRDPDALAEALKEFFLKHKLPKRGVRLGIANNRIGVRTFDIAGITDQKQLDNAIRFRAQEALPIPIEEAVLDYQVLGEGTDEEGQPTRRILLVVAYRELIDRYVDACKKAGITLAGIDLEAFALLRALQAPQAGAGADEGAALVAVAIGHERSTFAVSDGRVCEFTRVLEWGGTALNVAIARVVDAAPSEVEGVKRALALTDEMVPEGLNADQAHRAREAMRRAIQTFARELVSSLQYYQNQPGSLGIGEIVLTGGTAHLPGIAGELERLIGVRVRVGDPLARMKVSKKLSEPEQVGSLAVAIGLGIED